MVTHYDSVGNITSKSNTFGDSRFDAPIINYGENEAGPYAITSQGSKSYIYDADGNMTKMPGQSFLYNNEDNLEGVTKENGDKLSFTYDFDGQRKIKRVTKAEGSAEETIYIDSTFEIRNNTAYKYVWLDDQRLARVETTSAIAYLLPFTRGGMGGVNKISPHYAIVGSISPAIFTGLSLIWAIILIIIKLPRQIWNLRRGFATATALILIISSVGTSITGCGGFSTTNQPLTHDDVVQQPQENVVYYLDDHLGNTHLLTDSQGKILHEESRYAFGLEKHSEGDIAVDYVYTGKELDKETGLVYFGKRYYHPETGRWIKVDKMFLEDIEKLSQTPAEFNLYAHVQNDPVNNVDMQGDFACGGFCIAAIVGVLAFAKTTAVVKGAQYFSEHMNDQPIGTNSKPVNTALAIGGAVPVATLGIAAVGVNAPAIAATASTISFDLSCNAYLAQTAVAGAAATGLEYAARFGKEIIDSALNIYLSNPGFWNEVGVVAVSGTAQGVSETLFPPEPTISPITPYIGMGFSYMSNTISDGLEK